MFRLGVGSRGSEKGRKDWEEGEEVEELHYCVDRRPLCERK